MLRPDARSSTMLRLMAVAAVIVTLPLRAQEAVARDDVPTCLRFTFGPWTPALDWKTAGHRGAPDSSHVGRTPEGRGWAAPSAANATDTVLVLFPAFWPAGVLLEFDPRALTASDTVTGKATALVADAHRPSPVSRARVWRVACAVR